MTGNGVHLLGEYELLTVRGGDLQEGDVIELPELVWVWGHAPEGAWRSRRLESVYGLPYPRWHLIYDSVGASDWYRMYPEEEMARQKLQARFVLLRIATEQPTSTDDPDMLIAVHEHDLVRVQRAVPPPVEMSLHQRLEGLAERWERQSQECERKAGSEPSSTSEIEDDALASAYGDCARELRSMLAM